jgi:hypothetical protein
VSGARKYFTGVPCPRGHIGQRYASDRSCVECKALKQKERKEYMKQWRSENPEYHLSPQRKDYGRNWQRLKKYGIDKEGFEELLHKQGGLCACCGRVMDNPHVDHCHETGLIRGLLCFLCNSGIGKLGDNLCGVLKAVNYLTAHIRNIA